VPRTIAVIDLGSNSFLLSIAQTDDENGFRVILDEAQVVGLVKKLDSSSCVAAPSLERARACLARYRELISVHGVDEVVAVATESLRRPQNSEAVRSELERVLGHRIEIISGEREASLSFSSVRLDPLCPMGNIVVFDIGGASTEVVCAQGPQPQSLISIPIGSVLLTERFQLDRPTDFMPALDEMKEVFAQANLSVLHPSSGVGVAGTVTSLVATDLSLSAYDRQKVHGRVFDKERLKTWIAKLSQMSLEERKKIVGLTPQRADVFLGGLIIILGLMEHFKWSSFYCFDSGVRYGLLYEKFAS
jgi:exopolyphosphatase/guanosine-5'-triphosphate,3'-diphosphate pyrophosphatase